MGIYATKKDRKSPNCLEGPTKIAIYALRRY